MTWVVILAVGLGQLRVPRRAAAGARAGRALRRGPTALIRHAGLAALAALIATSAHHAARGAPLAPSLVAVAVGRRADVAAARMR